MKLFLIAIVVFCISIQVAKGLTKLSALYAHYKCRSKSKVDNAMVKQATKGHFKDDPHLKKYLKCFFERIDVLKGSKINENKLEDFFLVVYPDKKKSQASQMARECSNIKAGKPEERVFAMAKCGFVK